MISTLPVEILDHILDFVDESQLQSTTLNLIRSTPSSQISLSNLVRHVKISREGQTEQLLQFLRKIELQEAKDESKVQYDLRGAVRSVQVEAWREDPQTAVDLYKSFPSLISLFIAVGPLWTPEVLGELLQPKWRDVIEEITMRFNPYVSERSYYSFLKGSYYDCVPIAMCQWPSAGKLRRLRFIQDLGPRHRVVVESIPAWGFRAGGDGEAAIVKVPTRRVDQEIDESAFAQPIVFFRLQNIASLALSPAGSTIQSLTLQLPRRDLLPALTAFQLTTIPKTPFSPFPSLIHLNLSNSHFISYERTSLLLRLYPRLQTLTLDRCSGLVQEREKDETSGLAIIKWFARQLGSQGSFRAQDAERAFKALIKDRPTGKPAPGPNGLVLPPIINAPKKRKGRSGYGIMPKAEVKVEEVFQSLNIDPDAPILRIKDIIIVPALNSLTGMGLGLFDYDQRIDELWQNAWIEGYGAAKKSSLEKLRTGIKRWKLWQSSGMLEDGDRRLVAFGEDVDLGTEEIEPDEIFRDFLILKNLKVVSLEIAEAILVEMEKMECTLCTIPDCPDDPGVSHYSLLENSTVEQREEKEKAHWKEEFESRSRWRKSEELHQPNCAHLITRRNFNEIN